MRLGEGRSQNGVGQEACDGFWVGVVLTYIWVEVVWSERDCGRGSFEFAGLCVCGWMSLCGEEKGRQEWDREEVELAMSVLCLVMIVCFM